MGRSRLRRPPAPADTERARSIAARGGAASLVATGEATVAPLVHQVRADGSAVLLFADDEPVVERIRRGAGNYTAMLELTDTAPVDLRQPVRGLLWVTGRLWLPEPETARRFALQVADANPHPDLLRLGHGATLVRLDPDFIVLSDAEGSAALAPVELAGARPDPFCRAEQGLLSHMEKCHPETLTALARHLPAALRERPDVRVRPLGLDRLGLRLRVETPYRDHDVRLSWDATPATVPELWAQLRLLIGLTAPDAERPAV
ncbi:DUF2470 domain-containing protein [Pseudonocardia humida]|uniref:DUF2470 domain-containing protein n=1 Tax=Pseudonocardia humida TaxID=2800819 RepID=A0ABT1A4J9_9PSEU|nr:DUF2470 domain-containing protein [Pseudonocardia humida]MCO1657939.1 DUF2470 domain-containing protein [Pseudonocardia humida]